jgi:hypothetical protein
MTTDFADAHQRHLIDAKTLYDVSRWANADHLYGLSAECGLKALMIKFGMPAHNGEPDQPRDRVHVNYLTLNKINVWDRYEAYRSGHHQGVNYQLPQANPFANWDVNQRYAHCNDFSQTVVEPHKQGAECVKGLIRQAQQDGLLP